MARHIFRAADILRRLLPRERVRALTGSSVHPWGCQKSEDQMWKRDEAVKPTGPGTPAGPAAPAQHQAQANAPAQPEPRRQQMMERDVVNIGKSVVIKGELNGSEDLTVEGHVEGKI